MRSFTSTLLFIALAAPAPQEPESKDPPKITIEKTGSFKALIGTLASALSISIGMPEDVEDKEIKVSIKDAGLYEALDALCRAHGKVIYFEPGSEGSATHDPRLSLSAGDWTEYPTSYSGHFKTMVSHLLRVRRTSAWGTVSRVEAELCVMAPPWHNLDFSAGSRVKWTHKEARDHEDRDVLAKAADSTPSLLSAMASSKLSGNLSRGILDLADFDLDKGLRVLAGSASITVADSQVVRIPVEVGKSFPIPGGTITVESSAEFGKGGDEVRWRISFTVKPDDKRMRTIDDILESRVRFEGNDHWSYNGQYRLAFDVETDRREKPPTWIEFKVRTGQRKLDVPFRFTDVSMDGRRPW
jgi:hypothetical protein